MSEKKGNSMLLRIEFIVIAVFFISVMIWGVSRCNAIRAKYSEKDQKDKMADSLMQVMTSPPAALPPKDTAKTAEVRTVKERYTPLYAIVDGVNVRKEPNLNSPVVARLKLHEELIFLNEVTDFKQEISLGSIKTNEPWVKVKTARSKVGWVYGGTVNYYKKTLEGAE